MSQHFNITSRSLPVRAVVVWDGMYNDDGEDIERVHMYPRIDDYYLWLERFDFAIVSSILFRTQ